MQASIAKVQKGLACCRRTLEESAVRRQQPQKRPRKNRFLRGLAKTASWLY
jgi:hypothetical protein